MIGKPVDAATAAAPADAAAHDPAPAPINAGTPHISAFGRSFDLPPVGAQPPFEAAPAQTFPPKPAPLPAPEASSYGLPSPPAQLPTQANPVGGKPAPGNVLKLGLASIVKGCPVQDIGIAPDLIPSWVQVSLPKDLVEPQLSSGKVIVTLADVVNGLDADMRHLIVPAHPSIKVEIPASEVPTSAGQGAPERKSGAFSTTPASPSAGAAGLPQGVPWPFQSTADPAKATSLPPSLTTGGYPPPIPSSFPPAGNGAVPTFASAAGSPTTPGRFGAETPPKPATSSPPNGSPMPKMNGVQVARQSDKHSQMLLRVLLGSEAEDIDAEAVVRLTTSQPGVAAAVCFYDGRPVATSGNGSPEAENFLRQAQRMHDHVQPLVALTGIEDTETVSVKSDRHMVTFSLQKQVTLGVLHDPLQQEATLREKVTLIARELTSLLHAA